MQRHPTTTNPDTATEFNRLHTRLIGAYNYALYGPSKSTAQRVANGNWARRHPCSAHPAHPRPILKQDPLPPVTLPPLPPYLAQNLPAPPPPGPHYPDPLGFPTFPNPPRLTRQKLQQQANANTPQPASTKARNTAYPKARKRRPSLVAIGAQDTPNLRNQSRQQQGTGNRQPHLLRL